MRGVASARTQNELRSEDADEDVHQLYRRFKDSRKGLRSSASPPPGRGDAAESPHEALCCRTGSSKLTGLRVLDIDASRGR